MQEQTISKPLTLVLTPSGNLRAMVDELAPTLPAGMEPLVRQAFDQDAGHGLLLLGAMHTTAALPAIWGWWRDFAARYLTALRTSGDTLAAQPDALTLETLILDAPPMQGAEYLTHEVLLEFWDAIGRALSIECEKQKQTVDDYLRERNPAWNQVGRVNFYLAENQKDPEAPFAFLVTYTTGLSAHGKAQHLPLSQALKEFTGPQKKSQLLSLLKPVHRPAQTCDWVAELVSTGEIFHPLRWQTSEAVQFLKDLPAVEAAGIVVRMPAQWGGKRPSRPKVRAALGSKPPSNLGIDAMLDFSMDVSLDGEPLTQAEIRAMLAGQDGLQWIRGRWVEVDRDKVSRMLERFREVAGSADEGLSLAQAMRLLAGSSLDGEPRTSIGPRFSLAHGSPTSCAICARPKGWRRSIPVLA